MGPSREQYDACLFPRSGNHTLTIRQRDSGTKLDKLVITNNINLLAVNPTSVAAGGTVTATWAGIPSPTSTDWIALYTSGASDTAYLAWRYTTGTVSGNVPFTIPSTVTPGTYELRLFSNNGYTRLAISGLLTVP